MALRIVAEKLQGNPYVGPRPFERNPEDQARFFGRAYEAKQIVAMVLSNPETLVYSQSGAGKTSLFNAQIIPLLEEGGFQAFPSARVRSVLPVDAAPRNLSNVYIFNALLSLKPHADPNSLASKSLSGFLNDYPRGKTSEGNPMPRLIVFDQMEEIFNLYPENWLEQREEFFKEIKRALDSDPLLRIVFIIREEYLAQLEAFSRYLPGRLKARFRLERLRKDAALLAVKGPLEHTGRYFASGVAEKLVDDLLNMRVENVFGVTTEIKGEYVEPVHLQVVCQRLWQDTSERLSEITFAQLGDVNRALEDFYNKVIHDASANTGIKESALREWCEKKLLTTSGTRSIVHREAKITGGMPNNAVDFLEDKHLIRPEWRSGARWYELTHDRLIGPIKSSNKEWNDRRKSRRNFWMGTILPVAGIILAVVVPLIIFSPFIYQTLDREPQEQEQLAFDMNKNYTQALAVFDNILIFDPNNLDILTNKGIALANLGKDQEAIEILDRVLEVDPNNVGALYNKGVALEHLGVDAEAQLYFEKSSQIDSSYNGGLISVPKYKGILEPKPPEPPL